MAPQPQRRSIRFAIVAVVCLLLGAVTTVGVAWCGEVYWSGELVVSSIGGTVPFPPDWELRREHLTNYKVERSWGRRTEKWTSDSGAPGTEASRTGWPALAMWRGQTFENAVPAEHRHPGLRFVSVNEGIRLLADMRYRPGRWMMFHSALVFNGSGDLGHAQLPVLPLFPGFVVDTAVYGAAWYVVMFTPLPLMRAGRRRFRVSRGMCGSCGYDLKGAPSGRCPECGA